MDEEVFDLLVLQAEGQHVARQGPEVGLDLVARPRRHLSKPANFRYCLKSSLCENLITVYSTQLKGDDD